MNDLCWIVLRSQRAVAHQMEFGRYHPKVTPKVSTMLRDYQCLVLPNDTHTAFSGHSANVKCVHFVGEEVGHLCPTPLPSLTRAQHFAGSLHCVWLIGQFNMRLAHRSKQRATEQRWWQVRDGWKHRIRNRDSDAQGRRERGGWCCSRRGRGCKWGRG